MTFPRSYGGDWIGSREEDRTELRRIFLERLPIVVPDVLAGLHAIVEPRVEELMNPVRFRRFRDGVEFGVPQYSAEFPEVEEELRKWADSWHLNDTWFLLVAVEELESIAGNLHEDPSGWGQPPRCHVCMT